MSQSSQKSFSPIQRLDRLRTESPGVTNVHLFWASVARVPSWMTQRSTLLDQLQKRYHSQENSSASGEDLLLVAPSQPVFNTPSLPTITLAHIAASKKITDSTIAKSVAPVSTSNSSFPKDFRISHKAVSLTNSEEDSLSLKKFDGIPPTNFLMRSDRTETILLPKSLIQPTLQPEVILIPAKFKLLKNRRDVENAEKKTQRNNSNANGFDISSVSQLSQQPESSLILPKRISDDVLSTFTNGSATPSFSTQFGRITTAQTPILQSTNSSSTSAFSGNSKIYPLIKEQNGLRSLILPKSIAPNTSSNVSSNLILLKSVTSISNNTNSTLSSPLILPKDINSDISSNVSSPLILPKNINNDASSGVSVFLILPKHLNHGASIVMNPSHLSIAEHERSFLKRNETNLITVNSLTSSLSQALEPKLNVLRRINSEPTLSRKLGTDINLQISRQIVEHSYPTLNQSSLALEIISIADTSSQQPESALILLDRITRNTLLESKLILPKQVNSKSTLSTEAGTDIKSEIIRQIVKHSHKMQNQVLLTSEIISTLNTSYQQPELPLILPNVITQDVSSKAFVNSLNLNRPSSATIPYSSLNSNVSRIESANSANLAFLNKVNSVSTNTHNLNLFKALESELILLKFTNLSIHGFSNSSGKNFKSLPNLPISTVTNIKSKIWKNFEDSYPTESQPMLASEITFIPDISQNTELSFIQLRQIAQETSFDSPNNSIFVKQEIEKMGTEQENLNRSIVAIVQEIPILAKPLQQQPMIWHKTAIEDVTGKESFNSNYNNTPSRMPLKTSSGIVQSQIDQKISNSSNTDYFYVEDSGYERYTDAALLPQKIAQQNSNLNIEEVAEQVSRILHHQLIIERERRGMNLWY